MTTSREKEIISNLKHLEGLRDYKPLIHQLIFELHEKNLITSYEVDFFTDPERYTKLCQNWARY